MLFLEFRLCRHFWRVHFWMFFLQFPYLFLLNFFSFLGFFLLCFPSFFFQFFFGLFRSKRSQTLFVLFKFCLFYCFFFLFCGLFFFDFCLFWGTDNLDKNLALVILDSVYLDFARGG